MASKPLPYKRDDRGNYLVTKTEFKRPLYRPVDKDHVDAINLSMLRSGYDAREPIVCFLDPDGVPTVLTGEHRLVAASSIETITAIPVVFEPDPGSPSGRLARATALNNHLGTGDKLASKVIVKYLDLATKEGRKPTAKEAAAELSLGEDLVSKCSKIRREAVEELTMKFITDPKFSLADYARCAALTRAEQRVRVKDNNFAFSKKEKNGPLLRKDQQGKLLHILCGANQELYQWLTEEDPEKREVIFDGLDRAAVTYYAHSDAQAEAVRQATTAPS